MIGDDLKLWQKAAILIAAPLVLEIAVLAAVYQAQQQVDKAHLAERASGRRLFVTGVRGLKVCLDSISDVFNYRANRKPHSRERCQRELVEVKQLRESFEQETPSFKGTPLDLVMIEVEELLDLTIRKPDADFMSVEFRNFLQISRLASRAMKANEFNQSRLLKFHEEDIAVVQEKQEALNLVLVFAIAVTTIFALCLGVFFHKGTVIQIRALMENVSRLSRREALLPALSGRSELARLDQVFHSMANDIEALTARERSVLDNSNELILLVAADMKVELASRSSLAILERPAEEMIGLRLSVLSQKFVEHLESVKERGDSRFEIEFTNPSGKLVELEISVTWSKAEEHYYCVAHDIGARKELERMKQSFISMVSHDLRSPISASQAGLQLLTTDPECGQLSNEGTKVVNRMMASNTRLLGLITDLLDMEKLDYGLISLDYELVTFNDIIYECLSSIETLATAKGIKLVVDESDKFIYCDCFRIVQVIINIASNAVKVSKTGSQIEVRFNEQDGCSVISIIDHGPGIPEDFIPHLFDRFSQLSSNKAVARQGSGLGLSVAKKLVDLHQGSISVISVVGQGSTFQITLPMRNEVQRTEKTVVGELDT